ncbi:TetR/AcrR family transcriptional regulator [Mycolicibacterium sp. P1-18]|uniref:TetR/AcrR family transcriptional regulator n=1 Tax=Mycolicibacterium sp. P1-18 TaxID=2024615 RepID=UPI0011F2825F|nr:TetR/AcrR family transcriptional regulator [Mycolicibacterium sp. P1-18]KAA0102346.1 TetR/AcrR family transcriptional regulator [Mycolicibacterium sp. P1-18]
MASGDGSKAGDTGEDARVSRTRADVARAALEVLTTDGSDAVTHARVAEVAGYSKTTLYTHWPARVDLIAMAIESLGDMPHHERTGVLRDDLIGELKVFRAGVLDMRLDRVLAGMAEWASEEQMARIRQKVNTDGQHQMFEMLGELFDGPALDAAVSMLTGVVACPAIMFGTVPDDAVIEAAVDVVLNGHERSRS